MQLECGLFGDPYQARSWQARHKNDIIPRFARSLISDAFIHFAAAEKLTSRIMVLFCFLKSCIFLTFFWAVYILPWFFTPLVRISDMNRSQFCWHFSANDPYYIYDAVVFPLITPLSQSIRYWLFSFICARAIISVISRSSFSHNRIAELQSIN